MADDRLLATGHVPLTMLCTRISGEVVIDPVRGQRFQSVDDGVAHRIRRGWWVLYVWATPIAHMPAPLAETIPARLSSTTRHSRASRTVPAMDRDLA